MGQRPARGTGRWVFAWLVAASVACAADAWATAVPGPPGKLTATIDGALLSLRWSPPASGDAPTGYRLEVGSRAGASDLGSFDVGPITSVGPVPLPPITLYIRVRARNAAGIGSPSNEVLVRVVCSSPPSPWDLQVSVSNVNQVTIRWKEGIFGPMNEPTGYRLTVGITSFGTELGSYDIGRRTSVGPVTFPAGAYFIGLFATNACGQSFGIGAEVKVGTLPTQNPRWTVVESYCCNSGGVSLTGQVDGRTLTSSGDACGEEAPTPPFPGYLETTPGSKTVYYTQQSPSDGSCSRLDESGAIQVQFKPQTCYWLVKCGAQVYCEDRVRVIEHPDCEVPTTWGVVDDGCPSTGCGGG